MLDLVRLDTTDLHGYNGATNDREVVRIEGLVGLPTPKSESRPRPDAHGGVNRGKYLSSKVLTVEGEVWGDSLMDAYAGFDDVTDVLMRTLSEGPKLLQWRRPDDRNGYRNLVPDPRALAALGIAWASGLQFTVAPDTLTKSTVDEAVVGAGSIGLSGTLTKGVETALIPDADSGGVFKAGVPYRVDVYLRSDTPGGTPTIVCGTNTAADNVATVQPALAAGWQRRSIVWTPAADRAAAWLAVLGGGAAEYRVSAPLVSRAGVALGWWDGDSRFASWAGARLASSAQFDSTLTSLVKLAGPITPPIEEGAALLKYQVQLEADDPRAYSPWTRLTVGEQLAAGLGGGLTFPLRFPLVFDSGTVGGAMSLLNAGRLPVLGKFRIYGPVSRPSYRLLASGAEVNITGDVAAGDYLEVDHAAGTVKLNGGSLRMNMLNTRLSTFFELPPGTSAIRLLAAGSYGAGARLEAETKDAYSG